MKSCTNRGLFQMELHLVDNPRNTCREVVQTAHFMLREVLNNMIRILPNGLPISRCQLDLKHAQTELLIFQFDVQKLFEIHIFER